MQSFLTTFWAIVQECVAVAILIDLTANDAVIIDAIKYIQGQIELLNKTEKKTIITRY
jgi:hypothetical protein